MKTKAAIALWMASVCAVLLGGITIGRPKPSGRAVPELPAEIEKEGSERAPTSDAVAELEDLRKVISEKEREIAWLGDELASLKSQLRSPYAPEAEKNWQEALEKRRRDEKNKVLREKAAALAEKIVKTKDSAVRDQAISELAGLIHSSEDGDLAVGLFALSLMTLFGQVEFDFEQFRAEILNGMSHEDPAIRGAALQCFEKICSDEQQAEIALWAASDPSPMIRGWAVWWLRLYAQAESGEVGPSREPPPDGVRQQVNKAVEMLLLDDDTSVVESALESLRGFPGEIENAVIKVLGRPGQQDSFLLENSLVQAVHALPTISAGLAQRLAETYAQGTPNGTVTRVLNPISINLGPFDELRGLPGLRRPVLSDEARPIVRDIYLRVVRDSLWNSTRQQALEGLRRMGDPSVLSGLQEIANSPDAEGIEEELAKTIEHLRNVPNQPR